MLFFVINLLYLFLNEESSIVSASHSSTVGNNEIFTGNLDWWFIRSRHFWNFHNITVEAKYTKCYIYQSEPLTE